MTNISELKTELDTYNRELKNIFSKNNARHVYNIYATAYNNKTLSFEGILAKTNRFREDLQIIDDELSRKYGLVPADIPEWNRRVQQGQLSLNLGWAMRRTLFDRGYTEKEFHQPLREIFQECSRYFKIKTELGVLEWLMQLISKRGHPENIQLWDELTDSEKGQITSPGNPAFKKIEMPEGFYSDAKRLVKENDWTQDAIAQELIDIHFEGDTSKISIATVKRRLSEKHIF